MTDAFSEIDQRHMIRALELAARGQGYVEPNPMVGCVIVRGDEVIGEGWHRRFGGPHAEVEALSAAKPDVSGATIYVTLEPCCHHGKTPPCADAILKAGAKRVVVAMSDPFPQVDGGGLRQLREAGADVETGLFEKRARELNAPYLKLVQTGKPWMIAKWAMTLDGKIATARGDSKWISCDASREIVHQLRGRVDAVVVGRGTAEADDPLLTARPPGPRIATRVVLDSLATLSSESQLVRTVADAPVLMVCGPDAPNANRKRLTDAGCEVLVCDADSRADRLSQLLEELGQRRMTNILVEGGSELLGGLFDAGAIDEVHVFIAPKLIGGSAAAGPIAGQGVSQIALASLLDASKIDRFGDDLYITSRVRRQVRQT